jgi:hypothetical protein
MSHYGWCGSIDSHVMWLCLRLILAFLSNRLLKSTVCARRLKQGSKKSSSANSQARNADAVRNHLNFCMIVTTLIWIYADRLQNEPDRRRRIRGRNSVAFSDVRIIIADAALDPNFQSVCHRLTQTVQNSFIKILLRMVP